MEITHKILVIDDEPMITSKGTTYTNGSNSTATMIYTHDSNVQII